MHLYLHSVITDEDVKKKKKRFNLVEIVLKFNVIGSKCIVIIEKSQDGLQANK